MEKNVPYCALFPTFSSSMIPVTTFPAARLISLHEKQAVNREFDMNLT